jgi:uncharacterized protein (DUF1499 family)
MTASVPPASEAVQEGFLPCPESPNCVSSLAENSSKFVDPLHYKGTRNEAYKRLVDLLVSLNRTRMLVKTENYIHAEVASRLFRFMDDIEFWFPADPGIIHVRSASRSGYWDLGVNRKRVETIRQHFER